MFPDFHADNCPLLCVLIFFYDLSSQEKARAELEKGVSPDAVHVMVVPRIEKFKGYHHEETILNPQGNNILSSSKIKPLTEVHSLI